MNIKEIALKIARNMADFPIEHEPYEYQIKFAEALVAKLAKENKPVYYLWENKYGDPQQMLSSNSGPHPEYVITALYTLPPTAEQIEQQTAEAIAKFVYSTKGAKGVTYLAEALLSGKWKEYK